MVAIFFDGVYSIKKFRRGSGTQKKAPSTLKNTEEMLLLHVNCALLLDFRIQF